jgi:hypothetical protein
MIYYALGVFSPSRWERARSDEVSSRKKNLPTYSRNDA